MASRASVALGLALFLTSCTPVERPRSVPIAIGAQLYTVRDAMANDVDGTLRKVAALGYDEVEFAGFFGKTPEHLRQLLAELHMRPAASHVGWEQVRDDPANAVDETVRLGAPYVVLAWLPPEQRQTLDQWREWIARLNRLGAIAKERGIRVAYHAHDFEYQPIDGVRPIDLLQDELDPHLVDFEIDLYWTRRGGGDALALFQRFPGRYPLAHFKDMASDGAMADVGDGVIDFESILAAAPGSGLRHAVVERDDGNDPMGTLRVGLERLRKMEARRTSGLPKR